MADTVVSIKIPRLLEHQQEVSRSPARWKVLDCGRRWGKSYFALTAALDGHGPITDNVPLWKGALHGKKIVWIAPTIAQANEEFWPMLVDATQGLRMAPGYKVNQQQKKVWLPGGGWVSVRSGEAPNSIRGAAYDGFVFEEAAFQLRMIWTRILRPTLIDSKGWGLFISTPSALTVEKGEEQNWFASLWDSATGEGWERWKQPTHARKTISEDELAELTKDMSAAEYQEEILAEFARPEDLALIKRGWWRRYKVIPRDADKGGIFVDLAHEVKKESDYTAIATIKTTGSDFYWLDMVRDRMLFPDVEQKVRDLRAQHNLPVFVEETPGSKPLIQQLQRDMWGVIPWKIEGRDKLARVASISSIIEAGNCFLPEEAHWVHEFVEEHANFPNGVHDDMVDTSSMALIRLSRKIGRKGKSNLLPFKRPYAELSA
jgi:predicted phage terminase large subunit-like protein